MKEKKVFIAIIAILLLTIMFGGIKISELNKIVQNNKSIYCVMNDNSNNNKMEMFLDFRDGKAYRYSIINTNKITNSINEKKYDEFMNKSNKEHKGMTQKFWSNNDIYITTEYFEIDLLTDEELKEILGISKTELHNKTRKEIVDSIIPMGETGSFKCN